MSEIVDCISFIVRKTVWSLGVFLQFVFLRILDILGLVFNILACATLVRLPYMIMLFKDMDDMWEWRYQGLVQFLIFLSDIPVMLAAAIVTLTVWRFIPMRRELIERDCKWDFEKTESSFYYSGTKPRRIILKHFLLIFIDIVFVPAGLLCLISWRCVIFIQKMKSVKTDWERRKECFVQLFHLFLDIPCILLFFICCLTWRLPFVVREMQQKRKKHGWNKIRWLAFRQIFFLFLDIPCFICLILTTFSWRCVFLWRRIRKYNLYKKQFKIRRIVLEETALIFCDIPCIIGVVFVTATVFRFPMFVSNIKRAKKLGKLKQWRFRQEAIVQMGMVFVDIGCVFMSLFLLLTLWRTYPLIRDVRKRIKKWKDEEMPLSVRYDSKRKKVKMVEGSEVRANVQNQQKPSEILEDVSVVVRTSDENAEGSDKLTNLKEDEDIDETRQEQSNEEEKKITDPDITVVSDVGNETVMTSISMNDQSIRESTEDDDKPEDIVVHQSDEVDKTDGDQTEASQDAVGEVASVKKSPEGEDTISVNQEKKSEVGDSEISDVGETIVGYTSIPLDDKEARTSSAGEEKATVAQSKSVLSLPGWKIRKDIVKHFVFFFIDMPAIVLTVFLLVTYIKFPRLFSSLIQSGDFYLEFAITVYHLTLKLLIDVVFFFIFLILMILLPIDSWVHLLEDEEHKKYRLLCHYRKWIPDALARRQAILHDMDELLSVNLKMYLSEDMYRKNILALFEPYLADLQWVSKKVKDNELDPDFGHILDSFIFWEKKRPTKLARRYRCEYSYIQRPDPFLRKENLFKYQRELLAYQSKTQEHLKSLQDFLPTKVPLWSNKTGLSTRTRKETQKVLLQCLPRGNAFTVLLALLCCIPIYRAPTLIGRLYRRWYNRFNIIMSTIKEYGLDFLALLNILLVFLLIYRAPFLILDLTVDIFQKRSWKAARRTAFGYPPLILDDIIDILKTLASWKTPRFLVTTTLFGLLMPADLFLNVAKLLTKFKSLAFAVSALLYLLFIGYPCLHVFYLAKNWTSSGQGWLNIPVLASFIGLLLFVLLLMVVAAIRKSYSQFHLKPDLCDYVHFNWYNIHVVIFEILEFLQLSALVFSIKDLPMYGSATLHSISNYLLLSFITFDAKFWLSFCLFWIWFFISGAPIIFEQILDDLPKGTCAKHHGWRLMLSLFANTLFVTMFETLLSSCGCLYPSCSPVGNITCTASLVESTTQVCWSGSHRFMALFGLLGIVWYSSTSLVFSSQYGDPNISPLDVNFSPLYNVIVNLSKGVIVLAAVLITGSNYVFLSIVIACIIFLVIFTIIFPRVFKIPVCNLPSFLVWRVAGFIVCALAAAIVVISLVMNDPQTKVPLIVFSVGVGIILIAAIGFAFRLRRSSDVIKSRTECCEVLLTLEERLFKDESMLTSWKHRRVRWRRMVTVVREARHNDSVYDQSLWADLQASPNTAADENVEEVNQSGTLPSTSTSGVIGDEEQALPPPPSYDKATVDASQDVNVATPTTVQVDLWRNHRDDITIPPFRLPLERMKNSGVNLLLVLEQSIHYLKFNFAFMAQRETWLSAVSASNWTGLLHCVRVLDNSLGAGFVSPSRLDLALGRKPLLLDSLEEDPEDKDEPPVYTPEPRDLETITQLSQSLRAQAVTDFASVETYGEVWSKLLDKILPTIPVIRSWDYEDSYGSITFTLKLRRPVSGTIKSVHPEGLSLARGASVVLGKQVEGTLCASRLTFGGRQQPKGKKGPIQVTVRDLSLLKKEGVWYIEAEGKKLKLEKALGSIGEMEWK